MTDLILTEADYRELVSCDGDEPTTDSVRVAKRFGKRHDNVLRTIDHIKCSAKFRLLNFEESSYINEQGKVQRMFHMTKDGFIFVVMGFTGEKASAWKEAFIESFNRMARELQDRSLSIEQQRHMWWSTHSGHGFEFFFSFGRSQSIVELMGPEPVVVAHQVLTNISLSLLPSQVARGRYPL